MTLSVSIRGSVKKKSSCNAFPIDVPCVGATVSREVDAVSDPVFTAGREGLALSFVFVSLSWWKILGVLTIACAAHILMIIVVGKKIIIIPFLSIRFPCGGQTRRQVWISRTTTPNNTKPIQTVVLWYCSVRLYSVVRHRLLDIIIDMGRKWRRRGGKNKGRDGGGGDKRTDSWASSAQSGNTKDWVASVVAAGNAQMEAFYAVQGLHSMTWGDGDDTKNDLKPVADFGAWQKERMAWRGSMGQVLPASFRIHRDLPKVLQQELSNELHSLLEQVRNAKEEDDNPLYTHDGTGQIQARQLSFLPDGGIAYQLNVDRTSLRKNARLKPLHEWLKRVTDAGHVTRQETVSMIPPAVLKPNPTDTVLDMCAAPGSKTSQLLEHVTEGCIVANDANLERAALLTHQLKRVASRNPACLVTACPAQFFPASVTKFTAKRGFDKVLADVPCTGDGTSRKNIDVWHKWTVRGALNLHPLQVTIASRGAQLLRKTDSAEDDTYLCYSTCSQSPVENEAVVAELLRRFEELELVPVELPGFRTRPGLSTWKVFDVENQTSRRERVKQKKEEEAKMESEGDDGDGKDAESVDKLETTGDQAKDGEETNNDVNGKQPFVPTSMDEVHLMECAKQTGLIYYENYESVPVESQKRLKPTVFPPPDADKMHLERCLRVLPHDNDTGGFFVALLRKKNDPVSSQSPAKKRARVDGTEATVTEESDVAADGLNDDEDNAVVEDTMETEDLAGVLDADNLPVSRPPNTNKSVKGAEAFVPVSDVKLDPLLEYYGFDKSPSFRKDCFMCRVGSEAKVIHYVSPTDEKLPAEAEMLALVVWRCRGDNLKSLVTQADMDEIERRATFLLGPSNIPKPSPVADMKNDASNQKEAPVA
eukprot:scaffold5017_cov171-Amphora_coffeaeformis.AAC.31